LPPVVIDNPILNSPFTEPARHFRSDDDGITSEIAGGRRRRTYFIPIPAPRTRGGAQLSLPGD
jgi:type III restriction enzyme